MPAGPPDAERPTHCRLTHPAFAEGNAVVFRHSAGDEQPSLVISLGAREAVIPIRELYRSYGIGMDSPDGRMLALVAEALDFVSSLRCGELLPAELRTGEASWQPEERHAAVAAARIRLRLAALIDAPGEVDAARAHPDALLRHADDPAVRQAVQRGFTQAARQLGLASAQDVVRLVGEAAQELAFIEALRERLLSPVSALRGRLEGHFMAFRGDASRREILSRTLHLAGIAEHRFSERFAEIDSQADEVMWFLRNAATRHGVIRAGRDWLYRNQRQFAPLLAEWQAAGALADELVWDLVSRTYHFLAQRFMPRQEWRAAGGLEPRHHAPPTITGSRLVW